ncbi:hypothetical protein STHAL_32155 [Streptomyces halstedii]|uniref:Uncharacterized protein n=1 Tax=Streptomyces halstedii TaxID=1944 RepID=A0ABS6U0N7_STRHA|nr:hypothetical protein [Streptomyces halstedii]MBV7674102.1 hypothetical protein [Streptomyces halstedii]
MTTSLYETRTSEADAGTTHAEQLLLVESCTSPITAMRRRYVAPVT